MFTSSIEHRKATYVSFCTFHLPEINAEIQLLQGYFPKFCSHAWVTAMFNFPGIFAWSLPFTAYVLQKNLFSFRLLLTRLITVMFHFTGIFEWSFIYGVRTSEATWYFQFYQDFCFPFSRSRSCSINVASTLRNKLIQPHHLILRNIYSIGSAASSNPFSIHYHTRCVQEKGGDCPVSTLLWSFTD